MIEGSSVDVIGGVRVGRMGGGEPIVKESRVVGDQGGDEPACEAMCRP